MAASFVGDTRKRSNTGGSTDSEDRVVLLGNEDPTNTDTDVSDDNQDARVTLKLTSVDTGGSYSRRRIITKKSHQLYGRYCANRYKRLWMSLFVAMLGLLLVILVTISLVLWDDISERSCADLIDADEFAPYIFEPNTGRFALCHGKEPLVEAKLGVNHRYQTQERLNRYEYQMNSELFLSRRSEYCVRVEWEGQTTIDSPLADCFDMGSDVWFGGYESSYQHWPINHDNRDTTPFVPSDYFNTSSSSGFGSILHPVWLSSKGVVIFVDEDVPLHLNINKTNHQICLKAVPHSFNCIPEVTGHAILQYTVCGFQNITRAVQFFLSESNSIDNSSESSPLPDSLLKAPIWSTFFHKSDWNQSDVKEFVFNITMNKYPISQLEISEGYSDHYGDLEFSKSRFSDINALLNGLQQLNIKVSTSVNPFINYDSLVFSEAVAQDRFYPGYSQVEDNDVVLVKWWNGHGAVINYLDSDTQAWQEERLHDFVNTTRLDSLKFEGGTETHLPHCVYSKSIMSAIQYTKQYVNFVDSQKYLSTPVVSVGYFSQRNSLLFNLLDRNTSSWGLNNGLHSILTTVLSLGLAGYPFVFPDTNGGESSGVELYVRWLQLTTFMPVMQISYPPWNFSQKVKDHVLYLIRLHEEIYNNFTKSAMSEALTSNYPIIRPLWWIEPDDNSSLYNNDQFLVGNNLLVAPIVKPSENDIVTRDVLIPSGSWKCISDFCNGQLSIGPTLKKYENLSLMDMLYFKLETHS